MEKINLNVVAQHRKAISIVGGTLGTQFFQVEGRDAFLEYAKTQAEVAANGNVDICLNRSPKRFALRGVNVVNVSLENLADGTSALVINKHEDGITADVTLPITGDITNFSKITQDAVSEALRGDTSKIFADPEKLATVINELNNQELRRVESVIADLQKAAQGIRTTMQSNLKKVESYKRELVDSTPKVDISKPGSATVIVDVKTNDD